MFQRPADADPTVTGPPADSAVGGSDGSQALFAFDRLAASDAASTPVPASDPTTAELPVIPGFTLHRILGQGGMGTVYLADDLGLKQPVALKVLSAEEAGESLRKRFTGEAAILAKLDHPHIVRVFTAGEAGGCLFFAMRHLPRGSLDRHLSAVRRDAATVVGLLAKVARAVQYLHEHGVLHRDLKPQNILLTDTGEPQVADFGIAKLTDGDDRTPTQTGARLGTYAYMAPEMIRRGASECGPAVDVWAVGLMLFELLAGRRPFHGSGRDPNLMFRIVADTPPSLLAEPDLTPGTDERLEAITLRALAKDPNHRYPSAAELAEEMEQWLSGQLPPAPLDLLAKRRRHAAPQPSVDAAAPTVTAEPPPAKPRRRWRATGWLAAGVAILAALGVALVFDRPTLAALLAKRGEVVVIDGKGRAKVEPALLENCGGVIRRHPEGYLELTGTPKALFEVGDIPDGPFTVEAEVAHTWGSSATSQIGLYFRRREHQLADGKPTEHAMFALMVDLKPLAGESGSARAGGAWADPNAKRLDDWFHLGGIASFRPNRHAAGATSDFRPVVIEVTATEARVTVGDEGPKSIPEFKIVQLVRNRRVAADEPVPTPPLLGNGFGFVVTNGTGGFRNVRVSRPVP